jgi:hypothetical protein
MSSTLMKMMNRQAARVMNKTCNFHFDRAPDVPIGTCGKGNEPNMPRSAVALCDVSISSHIDWRLYYTDEELRTLKLKHINLQEYPKHNGISHIG